MTCANTTAESDPDQLTLEAGSQPLSSTSTARQPSIVSRAGSTAAISLYIVCVLLYIFTTSQNQQHVWSDVARFVIIVVCSADGAVIFLLHKSHFVQNKVEIVTTFLMLALILRFILDGVTDGLGIIMASLFLAGKFPELRADVTGWWLHAGAA